MLRAIASRLYVPAGLAGGKSLPLTAAQAHRLRNVLRLAPGAAVAAFNANDGEWRCTIAELGRNAGALTVDGRLRPPEPEPDLWLLFAPVKRVRLDWLVEKATELGCSALLPVWTARTQAERINSERLTALAIAAAEQSERLNPERLRGVAIAAAEQSERLSVPEIRAGGSLREVIEAWPAERRLILCDETGAGAPIAAALADVAPDTPAAVLVGPEGGFAETELDALGKLPIVTRVGLGPRVLRAETAALAALAAFQAIAGDWRRRRSA